MCGIWSYVFNVALAMITLTVPAQVLNSFRAQYCQCGGFFPKSAVFALVLGISVLG